MRRYIKPGAKVKIVPGCRALEVYEDYINTEDTYTISRCSGVVIKITLNNCVTLFAFEVETQ